MKSYNYTLWETTAVCTLNEGLASKSPTRFRKSVIKAIVSYNRKGKTCYLGLVQSHTFPWIFPVWTCFFLLFSTDASTQSWRLWFFLSLFFPLSFSFLETCSFLSFFFPFCSFLNSLKFPHPFPSFSIYWGPTLVNTCHYSIRVTPFPKQKLNAKKSFKWLLSCDSSPCLFYFTWRVYYDYGTHFKSDTHALQFIFYYNALVYLYEPQHLHI